MGGGEEWVGLVVWGGWRGCGGVAGAGREEWVWLVVRSGWG